MTLKLIRNNGDYIYSMVQKYLVVPVSIVQNTALPRFSLTCSDPFERERISCKYINVKDNFRAKEKNLILNYNNKKGINHVCCKLERLSLNLFNYIFLYDMKGMWVLLSYLKPNLLGQGVHSTHPLMNFTWVNPTHWWFQKLFSGQLLRT